MYVHFVVNNLFIVALQRMLCKTSKVQLRSVHETLKEELIEYLLSKSFF